MCLPYDKAFQLILFLDPCDLDLGGHAHFCDEILHLETRSYWGHSVSQTHFVQFCRGDNTWLYQVRGGKFHMGIIAKKNHLWLFMLD